MNKKEIEEIAIKYYIDYFEKLDFEVNVSKEDFLILRLSKYYKKVDRRFNLNKADFLNYLTSTIFKKDNECIERMVKADVLEIINQFNIHVLEEE